MKHRALKFILYHLNVSNVYRECKHFKMEGPRVLYYTLCSLLDFVRPCIKTSSTISLLPLLFMYY